MSKGAPTTDELLLLVAIQPVADRGAATRAYVSWSLIEEVRAEFDRRGVDWRALKKRIDEQRGKR